MSGRDKTLGTALLAFVIIGLCGALALGWGGLLGMIGFEIWGGEFSSWVNAGAFATGVNYVGNLIMAAVKGE